MCHTPLQIFLVKSGSARTGADLNRHLLKSHETSGSFFRTYLFLGSQRLKLQLNWSFVWIYSRMMLALGNCGRLWSLLLWATSAAPSFWSGPSEGLLPLRWIPRIWLHETKICTSLNSTRDDLNPRFFFSKMNFVIHETRLVIIWVHQDKISCLFLLHFTFHQAQFSFCRIFFQLFGHHT